MSHLDSCQRLIQFLCDWSHFLHSAWETDFVTMIYHFSDRRNYCCAAVISPVGKVVDHGNEICFPSGMEKMGPITQKLYETLTGIQMGHIEAPEGWLKVIE